MIAAERENRAPARPSDGPDPRPVALALALHLVAALLVLAPAGAPPGGAFFATEVELVTAPADEGLPLVTDGTENRPGASLPAPKAPALASGGEDAAPRLAAAPDASAERIVEHAPAEPSADAALEESPPLPRAKPTAPVAVAAAEAPPRPATKPPAAAPSGGGAIVGPETAGGGELGSPDQSGHRYLSQVRAEIERNRVYPAGATRSRAVEGTAVFVLVVDRSGRLLVLQLTKSSGAAALDDTGAEMIRRAAPLPPVPPDIPGEALELEVALALSQR
jgi:protein TonB